MKKIVNGLYWLMGWHRPTLRFFFGMGTLLGHLRWELNTPKDHWTRGLRPLNGND